LGGCHALARLAGPARRRHPPRIEDGWAHRQAAGQSAAVRYTAAAGHAAAEPQAGLGTPPGQAVMSMLPPSPRCRALPTTTDPDRGCIAVGELLPPMVLCLSCYVLQIGDLGLG